MRSYYIAGTFAVLGTMNGVQIHGPTCMPLVIAPGPPYFFSLTNLPSVVTAGVPASYDIVTQDLYNNTIGTGNFRFLNSFERVNDQAPVLDYVFHTVSKDCLRACWRAVRQEVAVCCSIVCHGRPERAC